MRKLLLLALIFLPTAAQASCGQASWYGPGLYGNLTASGEVFRRGTMTAAHPHLPLGSYLRVTNQSNGRSVVVRVNDRGPFVGNRIIDVAQAAASKIGLTSSGVANVCIARL